MIYLIASIPVKLIKIGYSAVPLAREQNLRAQNHSPLEILITFPGARLMESILHDRFKAYRSHGEWFKYEGEFAEFVNEVTGTSYSTVTPSEEFNHLIQAYHEMQNPEILDRLMDLHEEFGIGKMFTPLATKGFPSVPHLLLEPI